MSLHLVSDGTFLEDGGAFFGLVPRVLWQQITPPDDQNRLPLALRCLLIETASQRILVDTGYGDKQSEPERSGIGLVGVRRLLSGLAALGVQPEDIDLVVNTHLHHDHCGGNTTRGPEGQAVPTFPRARYCIQRQELADALYPNELTRDAYLPEDYEPLERAGQLQLLSGDSRLTDEVLAVVTPGHTRGHQSVVITSQGETAIYLGDAACWPVHMEHLAWVPAYDLEPMVSIETKRRLARWAIDRQALLLFNHHPTIQAGYLRPTERPDRFRLEPVEI